MLLLGALFRVEKLMTLHSSFRSGGTVSVLARDEGRRAFVASYDRLVQAKNRLAAARPNATEDQSAYLAAFRERLDANEEFVEQAMAYARTLAATSDVTH